MLVERIEALRNSEPFKAYVTRSGLIGVGRPLVLAYLVHCIEVLKPSEGLPATQGLLSALGLQWSKG